jgi:hypothetical protein
VKPFHEAMRLGPRDIAKRDRNAVELALPAHMLFLILEEAARRGIEMREDLKPRLDLAATAPLRGLDTLSISRVAKRIDDAATSLIRLLITDDVREAIYELAMFPIILVDEGHFGTPKDQGSMATLVGLMLIEDAKSEPDVNGFSAIWQVNEQKWKKAARDILRNAQLLGYYNRAEQLIPTT